MTHEARKTTPIKTTKNMEHRQHGKPGRRNHTLHHSRSTNQRNSKNNTIPCHKHRERRCYIRISVDGRVRTSIHMEERRHQRKRTTCYSLVCEPFHSQKRSNNSTGKRGSQSSKSHNLQRTCNQSATVHKKGGSPKRIPTIRQGVQRTRIKTIPAKMSLGSRNRIQKGRTRCCRLQGIPHELN